MKPEFICDNCGTAEKTKTVASGSLALEVLLWCLFIIPGVIYSLSRIFNSKRVCSCCGGRSLVPINSPRGRELAAHYHPGEDFTAPANTTWSKAKLVFLTLFFLAFLTPVFYLVIGAILRK